MTWVLKFSEAGALQREEFTSRDLLDERVATLAAQGKCCVIVPLRDEAKVPVATCSDGSMLLGPAAQARFPKVIPIRRSRR